MVLLINFGGFFVVSQNSIGAKRDIETWVTHTIIPDGDIFGPTSIALDGNDNPHICFVDDSGNLLYAKWEGNDWEIDSVEPSSAAADLNHIVHSPPPPMATKMSGKGITKTTQGMLRSRTARAWWSGLTRQVAALPAGYRAARSRALS